MEQHGQESDWDDGGTFSSLSCGSHDCENVLCVLQGLRDCLWDEMAWEERHTLQDLGALQLAHEQALFLHLSVLSCSP